MNEGPFSERDVSLTPEQEEALFEVISLAFTISELKTLLRFRLGVDLDKIVAGVGGDAIRFELLKYLVRYNRVAEFTNAALQKNPKNTELNKFAQDIGLIAGAPRKERLTHILQQFVHEFDMPPNLTEKQQFERMLEAFARELDLAPAAPQVNQEAIAIGRIIEQPGFFNPVAFATAMSLVRLRLCRVDYEGSAYDTGFLVGPRQVMTVFHGVEPVTKDKGAAQNVQCRFEYVSDGHDVPQTGKLIGLNLADPILTYSPFSPADGARDSGSPKSDELDFAILNLEEAVGEQNGWFKLSEAVTAEDQEPLIMISHPLGEPVKASMGEMLGYNRNQTRLQHSCQSAPGSAGAPCLRTTDMKLVGMHHAKDPDWRKSFRAGVAIPSIAIRDLLRARGIELD